MKFLIVGLGNIGDEYANTRHNIGFKVLDELARLSNTFFTLNRYAYTCELKFKGRTLILVKPTTFMNLSGKAVKYWVDKEKISIENILVITDDIALPFGTIRIRAKGSDGGHNGLKSVQEYLLSDAYPRLRIGIGNDFPKGKQADYVLGEWTKNEKEHLEKLLNLSVQVVQTFVTQGIQQNTMKIPL